MSTSPAISTPVKQISPSPIAACMSPTANIPPGCRTGKKMREPLPCQWSSRLPPCRPACPVASVSPSVATPTTPTIGFAGNEIRSFIFTIPSRTWNIWVTGACDEPAQLPEAGNQRRDAPLDRPHVEDLRHERVARLGAAHGHRPGGAVDATEVDVGDEVGFALDLPGEAVVRLEGDDVARLDLEDGLEIGAEGPDHLVTREPVPCHVSPVRGGLILARWTTTHRSAPPAASRWCRPR